MFGTMQHLVFVTNTWCVLTNKTKEIIHECSNGEYIGCIHSGAHNLESDLIILLYDHVLVSCLVTRRVGVGVK